MTTRSLILHPHEVRAALDGRLGLVVRPVKLPAEISFTDVHFSSLHSTWGADAWVFSAPMDKAATGFESVSRGLRCPLGVPGDRLRCKETWCNTWPHSGEICPDGPCFKASDEGDCGAAIIVEYDGEEVSLPQSQIEWPDDAEHGDLITVTMPEWLAMDRRLI